jgi:hypothetical protein
MAEPTLFSFSTRLGIVFIVESASLSAIAVASLLLYIVASREQLCRLCLYLPVSPVQRNRISEMAHGDTHALLLCESPHL